MVGSIESTLQEFINAIQNTDTKCDPYTNQIVFDNAYDPGYLKKDNTKNDTKLLDKDKLWIVAYVGVQGKSHPMAMSAVSSFENRYKPDDSVKFMVVPDFTSDITRFEVVYVPDRNINETLSTTNITKD